MSQVIVFAADSAALVYTDKKGTLHGISAEGAVFQGGAALTALKDVALSSALSKAVNGRYTAAADILGAAFPAPNKACVALVGHPATNKSTFGTLVEAVRRVEPKAGKAFSAKQVAAKSLVAAYLKATEQAPAGEVIEAEAA